MHLLCECYMYKYKTNQHLRVTSLSEIIVMKTRRTPLLKLSNRFSCVCFNNIFHDVAELLKLISIRKILPWATSLIWWTRNNKRCILDTSVYIVKTYRCACMERQRRFHSLCRVLLADQCDQWRSRPKMCLGVKYFGGVTKCVILGEQLFWDAASQSTKWLDMIKIWGAPGYA